MSFLKFLMLEEIHTLGKKWNHRWSGRDVQENTVFLTSDLDLDFYFLLFTSSKGMRKHVLETLDFALLHTIHSFDFWEIVWKDTFIMNSFGYDQLEVIICMCLVMECLNHYQYKLPRECFDLTCASEKIGKNGTEDVKKLFPLLVFEPCTLELEVGRDASSPEAMQPVAVPDAE